MHLSDAMPIRFAACTFSQLKSLVSQTSTHNCYPTLFVAGQCPMQGALLPPTFTNTTVPTRHSFTLYTFLAHLATLQLCPAILLDHTGHALALVAVYLAITLLLLFPRIYQTQRSLLLCLVRVGPLLMFAWQTFTMTPDCLKGTTAHGYLVDCNQTAIANGWLKGAYIKHGLSCWQLQHHLFAMGVGWLSTNLPVGASLATSGVTACIPFGMHAALYLETDRGGCPHCSKPTSLTVRRSWWGERRCNNVTMDSVRGYCLWSNPLHWTTVSINDKHRAC